VINVCGLKVEYLADNRVHIDKAHIPGSPFTFDVLNNAMNIFKKKYGDGMLQVETDAWGDKRREGLKTRDEVTYGELAWYYFFMGSNCEPMANKKQLPPTTRDLMQSTLPKDSRHCVMLQIGDVGEDVEQAFERQWREKWSGHRSS